MVYLSYGISVSEYTGGNTSINTVKLLLKYFKGVQVFDDSTFNSKDEEGNVKSIRYNIYTMNGTKLKMGPCDDTGFYSELGGRIYSFVGDTVKKGDDGPAVCVDINGTKGPNKYGYDLHIFYFTTDGFVFPMGQPHRDTSENTHIADHSSKNFFVSGKEYCKSTSNIKNQGACAYYALQNVNPQGEGNYWQDYFKYWNKNYGTDGRMSYDIGKTEEITDADEISALESELKTDYNITVEIKKAVTVSVNIDDGGTKASEQATFVKIGNRWCCMKAMEDIDFVCQNDGYNVW